MLKREALVGIDGRRNLALVAEADLCLFRTICTLLLSTLLVACGASSPAEQVDGGKQGYPDTGEYSIIPIQGLGEARTRALGSLIESHRLAEFVLGPWEVSPEFSRLGRQVMALDGGSSVDSVLPWPVSGAALRHQYLAGFTSSRRGNADAFLTNSVLVFPDSGHAIDTVRELVELAANEQRLSAAAPIASRPDVTTYTWKGYPDCCSPARDSILAFIARGRYLLIQEAWSPGGPVPASDLISKTIDLQSDLIDQFTPTPEDQLAKLRVDPTGLLARTIPVSAAQSSPTDRAVYGLRGTLHFERDATRSAETFRNARLRRSARAATGVYETETASGAEQIAHFFYDEASANGVRRGDVAKVPGSSCVGFGSSSAEDNFYCVAHVGHYAIDSWGEEKDAKQRLAAQYLLLTPT
ncbi:DUF7373 family lipoprotein [Mycobacterium sp. Root265]|uniref:DUF7373 family lipoprotein n=1 Tax=Mycobacterium sp. Root265 TaxID=1736504 RepID=UPI000ABE469B